MFFNLVAILCLCIIADQVKTKNLHVKEANTELEDDMKFQDIYKYDEAFYTQQDRYARHVELVTESILEHLLQEINKKYPDKNNKTHVPKMMKRLKTKLKHEINKKKHLKKKVKRHMKNGTQKIHEHQIS